MFLSNSVSNVYFVSHYFVATPNQKSVSIIEFQFKKTRKLNSIFPDAIFPCLDRYFSSAAWCVFKKSKNYKINKISRVLTDSDTYNSFCFLRNVRNNWLYVHGRRRKPLNLPRHHHRIFKHKKVSRKKVVIKI